MTLIGGAINSGMGSKRGSSEAPTNNTATENFLLKVRINALKNKVSQLLHIVVISITFVIDQIGFRGLTMEQRVELEERIQKELFNFHFNQDMHADDRTAVET